MHASLIRSSIVTAAVLAAALAAPAAVLAGAGSRDHHAAPNHKISHGTSTNWSGYAVQGFGTYQSVSASWTQPAVECVKTPKAWSAFWVGLDGDTTNTVEQTGSEADCSSGKAVYYAWYEMYPKFPVNLSSRVLAADHLTASVSYLGSGSFKLTIADTTQKWTQSTTQKLKSAKLGSAEAIAEAPSGSGGVLPLADFGSVSFAEVHVDGALLSGSTPGIEPITMASGETVKAEPSAISAGAFTDTWHNQ
jgi:hypothetical protein